MSGRYIANLCYERVGILDEKMRWVRLGSLWWGGDANHYATIKMDLWHEGSFIAKALMPNAPYISGDIFCISGKEPDENKRMVNIRHKVGHIQTSDSEHGVYYSGELLVSCPVAAILYRLLNIENEDECFLRLRVDLDDKE